MKMAMTINDLNLVGLLMLFMFEEQDQTGQNKISITPNEYLSYNYEKQMKQERYYQKTSYYKRFGLQIWNKVYSILVLSS